MQEFSKFTYFDFFNHQQKTHIVPYKFPYLCLHLKSSFYIHLMNLPKIIVVIAMKTLINVIIVDGEKISRNSRPSSCLKPFATKLALYLSIDLGYNVFLQTHLQTIDLLLGGKSTNFHALVESSDCILSFITSFQKKKRII